MATYTYYSTTFTNLAALASTTSATPVTLLTLNVTVPPTAGAALVVYVSWCGEVNNTTAAGTCQIFVDGVGQTQVQGTRTPVSSTTVSDRAQVEGFFTYAANSSSVTHTIDARFSVPGGNTFSIDPTDGSGKFEHLTITVVVLVAPISEESQALATPIPDVPPMVRFPEEQWFNRAVSDGETGLPLRLLQPDPIPPPPPQREEISPTFLLTDDPYAQPQLPPDPPPGPQWAAVDEPFSAFLLTDDPYQQPQLPPEQPPGPVRVDEPFSAFLITDDGYVQPQLPPDTPPGPQWAAVDEAFAALVITEDGYVIPPLPPEVLWSPTYVDEPFMGVIVSEDGYVIPPIPPDLPWTPPYVDEPFAALVITEDGYLLPQLPPEPPPLVLTPPGEDEGFPGAIVTEDGYQPPLQPPELPPWLWYALEVFPSEEPPTPPGPFITPGTGTGGYGYPRLEIVDVRRAAQFFFAHVRDLSIYQAALREKLRRELEAQAQATAAVAQAHEADQAHVAGILAVVRAVAERQRAHDQAVSLYRYQAAGSPTSAPPTPGAIAAGVAAAVMAFVAAAREKEEKRVREGSVSPRYVAQQKRRQEIRISKTRRAIVAADLGWLQLERAGAKHMFEAGVPVKVLGLRNTLDDLHAAPVLSGDDFELAIRSAKMSGVVRQRAADDDFGKRDREPVMFFAREEDVVAARAAEVRALTPMVAVLVAAPTGAEDSPGPAMLLCETTPDGDLALPGSRAQVGEEVRHVADRACRDAGIEVDVGELRLVWVGEGRGQVTWYVFAAVRWTQVASPSHVTWVPPRALVAQASPAFRSVYERALRAVAVSQLV